MSTVVTADNFRSEISQLLTDYEKEAKEIMKETVPEAADVCVKTLRANSRKRTGKYAKGWTKKEEHYMSGIGTKYVVYNRANYRVAHLLEWSHVIRNQYGSYGSTVGDGVIADAADKAEEFLFTETQKRLGHDV